MMFEYFPEIYRYFKRDFTFKRFVLAIIVASLVSLSVLALRNSMGLFAEQGASPLGETGGQWAIQVLLILMYLYVVGGAVLGISQSITAERTQRTWDLQRLTPVSAWAMAVGKVIGPSLFSLSVGLCFVFWIGILIATGSGEMGPLLLRASFNIFCAAYFSMFFALVLSAFRQGRGLLAFTPLALAPVLALSFVVLRDSEWGIQVVFWGQQLSLISLVCYHLLFFGTWSFLGAKWKIGEELLDEPMLWRLPLFLISSYMFLAGQQSESDLATFINSASALRAFKITAFFAILVCFFQTHGSHGWWRQWLFYQRSAPTQNFSQRKFLNCSPENIQSVLVLAVLYALTLGFIDTKLEVTQVFMNSVRDILLIQLVYFYLLKGPEALLLIILPLRYWIGGIISAQVHINVFSGIPYLMPALEVLVYGLLCYMKIRSAYQQRPSAV